MSKKSCLRNPHAYSEQIQVEEPGEVVALQTYLRSKYGICYDYDFPARTAPGKEWYNQNWFQDHATYDHRWNKMSSDIFHFAHVEDFAQALLLIDKARKSRKVVLTLA
jgi:hypothetical protein